MVKTFIQTIDWHHSFRLLRKTLASLLIFSLLASDIAKAMEDEEARGTISLPPLTNPSSFVLDGDVVKREPLTVTSLSQPRLRSSSLSQIETPTLPSADLTSPRQAYSADSLPRPPLHDERTLQISSPLPANSPVAFDPLDPNPQEGNLPNPLFTMTEHLVQIESPFPLVSTMVPSSVPENHPPQSPKKISPLPKPGDTDDESDEFDDGEQDNSSFIIVFESNDVDSKNVQKRKEKRSVAQRQLGSPIRPTESTHLLSHSSINGEDFDGYMAREFVMLGTSPNATDALPPETPSWWQKLKSWASGRTWLPQQPTYTLESTQTRWLQDFRPQDRGNSDEEEIIGERRVPSLHVDHSSDESDDAQLESSGSSGNGSPQNIKPAVLFDDPNPNFLPILDSSSEESDGDSLVDDSGSPQSTHSDMPVQSDKKPLLSDEDDQSANLSFPPPPSSAYASFDDEDLEAGVPSAWVTFKGKLAKFFDELPPKAKAQLKRFHERFIAEKCCTSAGVLGLLAGLPVAVLFCIAMTPVYTDGLWYLEQVSGWQWLYNMFNVDTSLQVLSAYITLTLLPDAIPRNVQSWQMALSDCGEKWRHKGRNLLLLGACFLPSLIEPFYLLQVEGNDIIVTGDHGLNQFTIAAAVLAPPLFLDSYASNIRSADKGLESLKAGYADFNSFISKHLFHQARQILPSSEVNRQALGKFLDKASKYFEQAPDEHITDIYANLLQIQQSDAPEEAHKALLAISYLVSLGEEVIEGQKAKKSYYTLLADTLNWGSLAAGSVARGVVLYFIFSTILGFFIPEVWAEALGVIGAALAYAPRTLLEYKGMDGFFNHYLREETPTGHSSYGGARTMVKAGTLWQGLFFSVPLGVLTLQVNNTLLDGSPWFLLTAVPFVFTEVAAQTTSFNTTYNHQTTSAFVTLHNKGTRKCRGKEPSISYRRDLLVQLALQAQKDIKEWSSDLIDTVRMSVNLSQNLERDPL